MLADADAACGLDWSLVAAIGRVESDHGRAGGNKLSAEGRATPGIYGVPLTGAGGTARITDTDGGTYDRDLTYDRAVGPMQFIPSTWSEVGVDADSDGQRDPQDVDDAALAAAVYLCAGSADLSTDAGRRAAVLRYNHSDAYVTTVLQIADGYRLGQFEVPTGVVLPAAQIPAASDLEPLSAASPRAQAPRRSASSGGQVLADPFEGGRVLTGADAELLVLGATGAPPTPSMLSPAEPLEITLRILNNIRAWAAARPERSDVQLWAVELSLLLPHHPARLRHEHAQLLVQRGDFKGGASGLEVYAEVIAPVDPGTAESVQREARAARAILN